MTKAGYATVPDQEPVDPVVMRLRALVRSLGDGDDENGAEQILMDTDLGDRRYILIRMPSIDRKQASLSPREIEIVRIVAEGHPNKVIAAVLKISSWTVCTHVRRVFAKLGVTSRAAMVARLAEFGGPMEVALARPSARQPVSSGPDGNVHRLAAVAQRRPKFVRAS